jgi:hypothetical protein
MKASRHYSWVLGSALGLLLACSSKVDSGDDGSGGNVAVGGNVASGGATATGGSVTNPSGGATVSGGTTSVAGSTAMGGTGSGLDPCSTYPAWSAATTYAIGDKVLYNGYGYMAINGGDPNAVNTSLDPQISTWWWEPHACEGEGVIGSGGSGSGGTGNVPTYGACPALDDLMTGAKFYELFTLSCSNEIKYSFDSLCTAVADFPSFASSGNVAADKRELAAFLAHAAKETWFLHYTTQTTCAGTGGTECGRGPIQITGWSNYQDAGSYLGLDLGNNPDLVATDPVIGWKVALWYWNVHSNPGAGSPGICHDAMNQNNFGQTTRIINGGIECGAYNESACKRASLYTRFCQSMGNSAADCSNVTLTCWDGAACGAVEGDCG